MLLRVWLFGYYIDLQILFSIEKVENLLQFVKREKYTVYRKKQLQAQSTNFFITYVARLKGTQV